MILVYLVSVVPLVTLFFVSNNLAIDEIYSQKQNTLKAYLDTNKTLLESEVARIYIAEYALIVNDTNIIDLYHRYGTMRGYELGTVVSSIHESLYYLRNTSSLIKDVQLYIDGIQRVLATNIYYNDGVTDEERLFYTQETSYQMMQYAPEGMYVVGSLKMRNSPSPYYLYCELDQDAISELFSKVEKNVFTIFYADDVVLTNGNTEISETIINHLDDDFQNNGGTYIDQFKYEKIKYHMVADYSESLGGTFVVYAPQSVIFGNIKIYTAMIWVLALLATVMILLLITSIYKMVKDPFEKMIRMFHKVEEGSLDIEIEYDANNEFGDLLHSFNFMVNKLKSNIHQIYEKNASLRIAELKQLQAQISPHFLYNSFNIIRHSIHPDNEEALSMVASMANYFRYITQNNKDTESLLNEFEFAKTYLDIQKARFGDKIDIDFQMIGGGFEDIQVPRMIIQPLIENSYKHAFSKIVDGGKLKIHWHQSGESLKIIVEDNGIGVNTEELEKLKDSLDSGSNIGHNGISNVHQRLKIKYQNDYGLTISSEEHKYFRNEITLPIGSNL